MGVGGRWWVAALLWGAGSLAQAAGFHMVQRVDDLLYGVDPVSLAIRDARHVTGTFVRVKADQPTPILGYVRFAVECGASRRLAVLSSMLYAGRDAADGSPQYRHFSAASTDLDALAYGSVDMLNGTWLVAEYACRATEQPGRAAQIAQSLYESGGPADAEVLACDLRPDGRTGATPGVEVRFSMAEQAVSVNHQWLRSGIVSDDEVIFGSGPAEWRVDRRTRQARLYGDDGRLQYTGACR